MVDDEVRHDFNIQPQGFDILPAAQRGIDPGMVNRIKARIAAVNGIIEWQKVNTAKQTGERAREHLMQCMNIAPPQAIGIGDELDCVFHGSGWRLNL